MRKRDDLESGYLYRVVQRTKGSDEEWVHSNYGSYGRPRTYMTVGAARSQKTRFENEQARNREYSRYAERPELEFNVQRAPVTDWEIV